MSSAADNRKELAAPLSMALVEPEQPQPRDLSLLAPDLRRSLLRWWELHGRRDPAQKPWMFTAEGHYPKPGEPLDAGGIWIAEVMLCSAA